MKERARSWMVRVGWMWPLFLMSCGGVSGGGNLPEGTQYLDVRTPEEWQKGHIAGAKLVTVGGKDFVPKVKAAVDPKKPVMVYCHSGRRSKGAAEELRAAGFSTVMEMDGGIVAWEKSGKPLVKGP